MAETSAFLEVLRHLISEPRLSWKSTCVFLNLNAGKDKRAGTIRKVEQEVQGGNMRLP
jgi:hypothetical protein